MQCMQRKRERKRGERKRGREESEREKEKFRQRDTSAIIIPREIIIPAIKRHCTEEKKEEKTKPLLDDSKLRNARQDRSHFFFNRPRACLFYYPPWPSRREIHYCKTRLNLSQLLNIPLEKNRKYNGRFYRVLLKYVWSGGERMCIRDYTHWKMCDAILIPVIKRIKWSKHGLYKFLSRCKIFTFSWKQHIRMKIIFRDNSKFHLISNFSIIFSISAFIYIQLFIVANVQLILHMHLDNLPSTRIIGYEKARPKIARRSEKRLAASEEKNLKSSKTREYNRRGRKVTYKITVMRLL